MIRADEIDPTLRKALAARITQIVAQKSGLDPAAARAKASWQKTWHKIAQRYTGYYGAAVLGFAASVAVPAQVAPQNEELSALLFCSVNLGTAGLVLLTNRKIRAEATRFASPELLRSANYLMPLSRAEQLYCEAAASLIDIGPLLGAGPQQEILAQLNELLASYRKLELTSNHYRSAAAKQRLPAIAHELAVLAQKRDALDDPTARETVEHSIRLCEQRLEQARRFAPLHQRAEAQEELVLQTMASLHASLERIRAAGTAPPATEMLGLRETVDEVTRQTRSVEEAVHEVMAFSGAGSGR